MAENLATGNSINFQFDADDFISVTGNATVIASGPSASVNTASTGTAQFGPYAGGAAVRIIATGAVTYTLTQPTRLGQSLEVGSNPSTGTQTINQASSQVLANSGVRVVGGAPRLQKLYGAFMKVKSGGGQAYIGWIDDSTGVGAGAGTGAKGLLGACPGSPIAQFVAELISAGIPAAHDSWVGDHLIQSFQSTNFSDYDTRFALVGTTIPYPNGATQSMGGLPFQINAGGEGISFTPTNAVDTAKTIYFNSLTSGQWNSTFAGGSNLGAVANTATNALLIATKTFTRGSGAYVTSWVAGDNAILGQIFYDSTTPRVNVINLSCYGDKLTSGNGYANNTNYWRGGAALSVLGLDACVVGMTINSSNQDGLAGVAAYETALTKVCQDVVDSGADLILKSPHAIGTVNQTNGVCDAYLAAIVRVATAFNAPILRIDQRINDYTRYNGYGFYFDTLHMTAVGSRSPASEGVNLVRALTGV